MFWIGFILGLVLGIIITYVLFQLSFTWLGEHPEVIERMVDSSLKEVMKDVRKQTGSYVDTFVSTK